MREFAKTTVGSRDRPFSTISDTDGAIRSANVDEPTVAEKVSVVVEAKVGPSPLRSRSMS